MAWTATIVDVEATLDEQTVSALVRYSDGTRSYDIRVPIPDTMTQAQARDEVKRVFAELKNHYLRVNTMKAFIGVSFPAE